MAWLYWCPLNATILSIRTALPVSTTRTHHIHNLNCHNTLLLSQLLLIHPSAPSPLSFTLVTVNQRANTHTPAPAAVPVVRASHPSVPAACRQPPGWLEQQPHEPHEPWQPCKSSNTPTYEISPVDSSTQRQPHGACKPWQPDVQKGDRQLQTSATRVSPTNPHDVWGQQPKRCVCNQSPCTQGILAHPATRMPPPE